MKSCLTTLYDDNFKSFAPIAINSFEKFCHINKLELAVYNKLFDNSIHPSWNKLIAIKKCFEQYDAAFWADTDSLFIGNQNKLNELENSSFITNYDSNGICLSHFFIKNTDYNNKLIDTLLFLKDVKDDSKFGIGKKWEQNTLKALMVYFNIEISYFKENTIVDFIYHNRYYENTYFYHFSTMDNHIRYSLMNLLTFDKNAHFQLFPQ